MTNRIDIDTLTKNEQQVILKFMRGKRQVTTEEIRKLMSNHLDKDNLFEYCIVVHSREYFSIQRPLGL